MYNSYRIVCLDEGSTPSRSTTNLLIMKHLVFNTSKSFPFLISFTALLCAVMTLIEDNPDYTESDILIQKIICGISVVTTVITFVIMWKNRYYQED